MSKLSDAQREDVRAQYAMGNVSYKSLAVSFGVNKNTIARTINPNTRNAANVHAKDWRSRNPNKVVEYVRAYWPVWYVTNADDVIRRAKAWSEANPEKMRQHRQRWCAANPTTVKAIKQKYRAASCAAPGSGFTPEAWRLVLQIAWNNTCAYCSTTDPKTIDHIIPLNCGGSHHPENLVPACRSCNSSKGDRALSVWRDGKHVWVAAFAAQIAEVMCPCK